MSTPLTAKFSDAVQCGSTFWYHFLGPAYSARNIRFTAVPQQLRACVLKSRETSFHFFTSSPCYSAMHILSFSGRNRALYTRENSDLMIERSAQKKKKRKEIAIFYLEELKWLVT